MHRASLPRFLLAKLIETSAEFDTVTCWVPYVERPFNRTEDEPVTAHFWARWREGLKPAPSFEEAITEAHIDLSGRHNTARSPRAVNSPLVGCRSFGTHFHLIHLDVDGTLILHWTTLIGAVKAALGALTRKPAAHASEAPFEPHIILHNSP